MSRPAKQYPVGAVLEKDYRGKNIRVRAGKDNTFQLKVDGKLHPKTFKSLQDVMDKITGGKKYPASVFFAAKNTAKRARKAKSNGTIEQTVTVESTNIGGMIQNAIRDAVKEKVEEIFRS